MQKVTKLKFRVSAWQFSFPEMFSRPSFCNAVLSHLLTKAVNLNHGVLCIKVGENKWKIFLFAEVSFYFTKITNRNRGVI